MEYIMLSTEKLPCHIITRLADFEQEHKIRFLHFDGTEYRDYDMWKEFVGSLATSSDLIPINKDELKGYMKKADELGVSWEEMMSDETSVDENILIDIANISLKGAVEDDDGFEFDAFNYLSILISNNKDNPSVFIRCSEHELSDDDIRKSSCYATLLESIAASGGYVSANLVNINCEYSK